MLRNSFVFHFFLISFPSNLCVLISVRHISLHFCCVSIWLKHFESLHLGIWCVHLWRSFCYKRLHKTCITSQLNVVVLQESTQAQNITCYTFSIFVSQFSFFPHFSSCFHSLYLFNKIKTNTEKNIFSLFRRMFRVFISGELKTNMGRIKSEKLSSYQDLFACPQQCIKWIK